MRRSGIISGAGRRRFKKGFVQRDGDTLTLDGSTYRFVGFNAYGMCGGEGSVWAGATFTQYFSQLLANSMTRTWAFDGNGDLATGSLSPMDTVVAAAESNNQKLILSLNNDLGDLNTEGAKDAAWYAGGYQTSGWLTWVSTLVSRYRQSPAIGMWEIINEAGQAQGDFSLDGTTMRNFYATVAGTIKALDPYHLVATGDNAEFNYEVTTGDVWDGEQAYKHASGAPDIDVLTIHDYELDFGGSTPISSHFEPCGDAAAALDKPIIVGELNKSACVGTKAARSATIKTRIDNYFGSGANGVCVWNYSESYYNTCGDGGDDYIIVNTDPLATAIRGYSFP